MEHKMGLLDGLSAGGARTSGMSPLTMALMGVLAYRTFQGKGRLAEMLGRSPQENPAGGDAGLPRNTGGGLGSLLSSVFGSGAGGILNGGLGDLLKQFQQNGQGEKADSWIEKGPNKSITPAELERVLGEEKIAWLMRETGMSRDDLLAGLSRELPQAVDRLTPDGRVPTHREVDRLM
jgi:uncharacterized protein YidB (DUF937 family)